MITPKGYPITMFHASRDPVTAFGPEEESTFSARGFSRNYIPRAFPSSRYHPERGERVVFSSEEAEALGPEWSDVPFEAPAPPPARPDTFGLQDRANADRLIDQALTQQAEAFSKVQDRLEREKSELSSQLAELQTAHNELLAKFEKLSGKRAKADKTNALLDPVPEESWS